MIPRHVETIYCDDIREEVGEKLSYMGVYRATLIVDKLPVVLPKFCIVMSIKAPTTDPIRSMTVRVLRDKDPLQEISFDEDKIRRFIEASNTWTDDERETRIQSLSINTIFSPLRLESPCIIRIRAITEREELRGQSLRITTLDLIASSQ